MPKPSLNRIQDRRHGGTVAAVPCKPATCRLQSDLPAKSRAFAKLHDQAETRLPESTPFQAVGDELFYALGKLLGRPGTVD
jgi:hypothetical protein